MMPPEFENGDAVTYRPHPGATPEDGVVTRTRDYPSGQYVHVLFRGDVFPKACRAEDLERAR